MSEKVAICSGCGVIPADEFGSHICKPRDLTVKLAEMREGFDNRDDDIARLVYMDSRFPKLLDALQAVLAMPEKEAEEGYFLDQRGWGYNQALADVRATIEGKVGK